MVPKFLPLPRSALALKSRSRVWAGHPDRNPARGDRSRPGGAPKASPPGGVPSAHLRNWEPVRKRPDGQSPGSVRSHRHRLGDSGARPRRSRSGADHPCGTVAAAALPPRSSRWQPVHGGGGPADHRRSRCAPQAGGGKPDATEDRKHHERENAHARRSGGGNQGSRLRPPLTHAAPPTGGAHGWGITTPCTRERIRRSPTGRMRRRPANGRRPSRALTIISASPLQGPPGPGRGPSRPEAAWAARPSSA
jgi:hypothetical protein